MELKKFHVEEILLYKKMLKTLEEFVVDYKQKQQVYATLKEDVATLKILPFQNDVVRKYAIRKIKIAEEGLKPYKNIDFNQLVNQMLEISKKLEALYKLDLDINKLNGKVEYFKK